MAKEYIGRDEMIEQAKARIVFGAPKFNTGLKAAIEVATSIPAADVVERPRWIPVTERLPEDRSDVLAYLKYEVGGRIAAANYDKGMWQDCVMGSLYRTEEGVVTHWMPIPQPPKEETR